jgi:type 1 fimbria pilin
MALIKAVTIIADHKGIARPSAVGDEYVVDAYCDVTQVVALGSVIPASDFGLSTITAVCITGDDNVNNSTNYIIPTVECSATGAYESSSSVAFKFTTVASGTTVTDNDNGGTVRVRVWGLI